jgi:hypothetical protein
MAVKHKINNDSTISISGSFIEDDTLTADARMYNNGNFSTIGEFDETKSAFAISATKVECSGLVEVILDASPLFVSPTGSDSVTRAGNDIDHPWLTVSKAVTTAEAGDTVYFRSGTYTISSSIDTSSSGNAGTEANPITYKPYPSETATID